jgi:undecaprenyl-diphosphatase
VISYFQAIVIGLLQGVTELFPVSSLGHSVLLPAWLHWNSIVGAQSASESFYLAFLVALHVATAIALLLYFRADWVVIIKAFFRICATRKITTPDERLVRLIVVASIPVGVIGLALEHTLRTVFAKPLAAAIFLTVNGVMLAGGEWVRRRSETSRKLAAMEPQTAETEPGRRLDTLDVKEAGIIGVAQSGALFAGISRSGITMIAGLVRGLDHEDAARFSFLLATPVILAAGLYKIPDLLGPNGNGVRGQAIAGSVAAGIAAYGAVRFLVRFFKTRNLLPFAVYCLLAGGISIARFA